ncbi:unnamed protein product [Ostreobium quekettii]|uniref:Uncharacterized protein n=1 Tax=Ostreobium quekettii TaxID=121088 RepID=A0A8S1J2Z7_9CHLO|nr:unnamed protein product [Ostreobium quekettii]|eukprot:evm.model.scf_1507.5 EVM.evm.TU.scf_1507.5   scf_1507:26965-30046(-)
MASVLNGSALSIEGLAQAVGALRLDAAWRRWSANNPEAARHLMAATSVALSLGVVSLSVFAGWSLMWYTTLRKVMFFRELFGLDRAFEEQYRIATEEEIRRVKRQHNRLHTPLCTIAEIDGREYSDEDTHPN